MSAEARALLDERRRCLLASPGAEGPVVAPMAYWSDGAHLWMSTATSTIEPGRLRRDGRCVVYVPGGAGRGVTVVGTARVFSAGDPVGLALHAPAITGAMTALAASNIAAIGGYVQDVARLPARLLPLNRAVVRVRIEDTSLAEAPQPPPGVAPALPPIVPPQIRRVLGGRRQIVLALGSPQVELVPAVWSAGFFLTPPAGRAIPAGTQVAAVLDEDPRGRPAAVMGLSLRGRVGEGGRLAPERATWWEGFDLTSAEVPGMPDGGSGIVLPD